MSRPAECEGAPRDLGRDQALAAGDAVRAAAGGSALGALRDRLGRGGTPLRRWRRDLRRYFPHQHEWLEGVARGAGVADLSLLRAAIRVLEGEAGAVLVGAEAAEGPLLWRSATPGALLRRVRPEGRFASLELASPLLACPWIGLNEAGLALAVTGAAGPGRCSAHGALLARDCLERFEGVASALAWCLGRPAAPGAAILLADARGEVAGVELELSGRRVRRPQGGLLVLGGAGAARLRKQLAGVAGERSALAAAVAGALAEETPARVDLGTRSLCAPGGRVALSTVDG